MLVVELAGTLSVAAGPPSHDLASIMRELGADVATCHLGRDELAGAPALVAGHPGRRPVIVVRDVDRHPWQQDAVAAILAACDRGVVVDVGYPTAGAPAGGAGRVTTFGAGAPVFSPRPSCCSAAPARRRGPRLRRCGRDRIDRARPTAARSDWAGRPGDSTGSPSAQTASTTAASRRESAISRLRRARSHPASRAASARGPSTRIRLTRPIPGQSSAS